MSYRPGRMDKLVVPNLDELEEIEGVKLSDEERARLKAEREIQQHMNSVLGVEDREHYTSNKYNYALNYTDNQKNPASVSHEPTARMTAISSPYLDSLDNLDGSSISDEERERIKAERELNESLYNNLDGKAGKVASQGRSYNDFRYKKKQTTRLDKDTIDMHEYNRTLSNLRSSKVKKNAAVCAVFLVVVLAAIAILVMPPVFMAKPDLTVSSKDSIFQNISYQELKNKMNKENCIYNTEAFKSDDAEKYRTVTITYDVSNPSVFDMNLKSFKVASVDSKYKKNVFCVSCKNPVTIKAFSSDEVNIDVIICVDEMSDKDFQKCVDSLLIKSQEAYRDIMGYELPIIQGFAFGPSSAICL